MKITKHNSEWRNKASPGQHISANERALINEWGPGMDAIITELEASWKGKPTRGNPFIRGELSHPTTENMCTENPITRKE
jgi:hypothetical protein